MPPSIALTICPLPFDLCHPSLLLCVTDAPGAGSLLQGGVRAGDRASPLPLQRAAAGGQQRPVHRVQAEAVELAAPLEEHSPETHQGPTEKER